TTLPHQFEKWALIEQICSTWISVLEVGNQVHTHTHTHTHTQNKHTHTHTHTHQPHTTHTHNTHSTHPNNPTTHTPHPHTNTPPLHRCWCRCRCYDIQAPRAESRSCLLSLGHPSTEPLPANWVGLQTLVLIISLLSRSLFLLSASPPLPPPAPPPLPPLLPAL